MKEKLLEILANLGFQIDEIEDWGVHFEYDEVNLIAPFATDDDEFLSIIVPGLLKKEDDPELFDFIIAKVNADIKYIKAYSNEGIIWLCYERECISGELTEEEVERMILHLFQAFQYIGDIIRENEDDANANNDDTTEEEEE